MVNDLFRKLTNIISIAVVISLMFLRGIWFDKINVTFIGLFFLALQFLLVVLDILVRKKIPENMLLNLTFVFTSFLNILLTSFYHNRFSRLSLMVRELFIVTVILINFNYFLGYNMIELKRLQNIIIFVGVLFSFYILFNSLEMSSIRRFKMLPVGVNYISHSLLISIYLNYLKLNNFESNLDYKSLIGYLFFIVQITALFLLGSRSSFLSLFLVIIYLSRRTTVSFNRLITITVSILSLLTAYYLLNSRVDLSALLYRFNLDFLKQGTGRGRIWSDVLKRWYGGSVFLGEYWNYEILGGDVGPHNIFLSYLYFLGIIPFFFFFIKNFKILFHYIFSLQINYMFPIFLISLVYSSLSGHFTRVYTIYLSMSFIEISLKRGRKANDK